MKLTETFFWRRLDQAGLDSCRLFRLPDGWRIQGTAVFVHGGRAAHLSYEVGADALWVTRRARVTGYWGEDTVDLSMRVYPQGGWTLNHGSQSAVRGCVDIDLGFSPAARVLAGRRHTTSGLSVPSSPVAVLSFTDARLLRQDPMQLPMAGRAVFEPVVPDTVDGAQGVRLKPAQAVVPLSPDLRDEPVWP